MVDFVCRLPLFDVIDHEQTANLCELLSVKLDLAWLEAHYDTTPRGQGDVYVFSSREGKGCLMLDLFQSPTDQHEIIELGIRCCDEVKLEVQQSMSQLYQDASPKSPTLDSGVALLRDKLNPSNYPKLRPTITFLDGREVYEYAQKLILY